MDFWATKDDYERETEEAERLMRPAPKVKPPRHDKRREDIRPERDPDVAGDPDTSGDPDMSLNYKNVGGSVAHRILARFLQADIDRGTVKVRRKDDPSGRVIDVSPKTLKERGGEYEKVEEEEPSEKGVKPESEPSEEKKAPEPESEKPQDLASIGRKLWEEATANPEKETLWKSVSDPAAPLGGLSSDFPLSRLKLPEGLVPKGIATLGDLREALKRGKPTEPKKVKKPAEKPAEPAEKTIPPKAEAPAEEAASSSETKKKAPKQPSQLEESVAQLSAQMGQLTSIMERFLKELPAAARPAVQKEIEEAKKTVEETKPEGASKKEQPPAPKDKKPPKEKSVEEEPAKKEKPAKPPAKFKPKPRPFTQEEWQSAMRAVDSLPGPMADALVESGYHPHDILAIVSDFKKSASVPLKPEDIDATIEVARRHGLVTNPSQIKPPKMGKNSAGKRVPWESLSPEEKDKAFIAHQNELLAASFALRAQVTSAFEKAAGVPRALADVLAGSKLAPKSGSLEHQEDRARKAAQEVYETVFTSGKKLPPIPDKSVQALMKLTSDDPVSQRLAVSYLQAQDALEARDKFLSTNSPWQIDERDPPNKLMANLHGAMNFLRGKQGRYPEAYRVANDPVSSFRTRVMERLRVLNPGKADSLEPQLWQVTADEWDEKQRIFDRLSTQRKKALKKHQKAVDAAQQAYDAERAKAPYRSVPIPTVEERLRDQGIVIPPEPDPLPPKPLGYDEVRKSPAEIKAEGRSFWDKLLGRKTASEGRIAARFLGFSICAPVEAMGKSLLSPKNASDRTSVYWGVEPYTAKKGPEEYPRWQQAHARDLKEADFNAILTSARAWLKEAVLSEAIEGILPDTQLRAALDLAIRDVQDGKYSVGLHPTLYNRLLARLGGESETETLLTVREASSGSLYAETTGEERPMRASAEIRKFASSIADENPGIAFDLANLAFKLAEEEKKEQEPAKEQQVQASGHRAGEMPPALKEHMEKQQAEKEGEDKEGEDKAQEGQKEASYRSLKAAVIKAAQANPAARAAFLPVLQAIKQIG